MSNRSNFPNQDDLDELQELMERVGEDADRVEKVVQVAAVDMEFYEDMRGLYQRQAAQLATKDAYYPYTALNGEFMIGTDLEGRPLGVTRRELNEHMLVVGRSGAGKTTFFYNLMDTCQEKDLPFMVFDFKNDYRHVADDFDLTVINWRDLKFNPLQPPPGVPVAKWGEVVAETYAHATDLLIGSESYFLERLRQLYSLYKTEIEDKTYPSLFELRDVVRAHTVTQSSPRFRYKERVKGRLNMMTGFSGEIFDCSQGYPIEELLDRNVVFELQEPNQYVTNFVIEAILTWIFYYRDAMTHRRGLRHVILFDEAKRVFSADREQQPEAGYPPVTELLGRVREFGEALVVADHEPSKLSDSVKANTNVKLWMSLGSGHDIEEMAATFGIEGDQVDFTRTLSRGEAVVATAEASPVPIRLPPFYVEEATAEDNIRDRMEDVLDQLSFVERVRPLQFREAIGEHLEEDSEDDDETGIGTVAERLLASVNEKPFLSISERYEAIDTGMKTGNTAKNELLTLDLVREVEVKTRKPGRNPKLLELTAEGRSVLERRGYEVVETGRRGIVHRYWQQQAKEYYEEQGFEVEIEHAVGQQSIDVYAERADEVVAIEVACSPEHELENVEKCLAYGVDRVEVAFLEESVRDRVEAEVREAFGQVPDRVEFVSVSVFS